MRDLCDRINVNDDDLRRKIWTCFELSLKSHTELMRDRHIDQILMCAIYSMCKVTRQDVSFQDIMKCYRLQPQSKSHVSCSTSSVWSLLTKQFARVADLPKRLVVEPRASRLVGQRPFAPLRLELTERRQRARREG